VEESKGPKRHKAEDLISDSDQRRTSIDT